MADFWRGSTAVFGTKHHKEEVVAPVLTSSLGITLFVPTDFDTDAFGTFTGDVARTGTQRETLERKAHAAAKQYGYSLTVASEGSFSPHPHIPFVLQNLELVTLIDTVRNITIIGEATRVLPTTVVTVRSSQEAIAHATAWGFPTQGVIVRSSQNAPDFVKDIDSLEQLAEVVEKKQGRFIKRSVFIEMDLRAHKNPARMKLIAAATQNLVDKCKVVCPQCGIPGFSIVAAEPGAPCAACTRATSASLRHRYHCRHCGFTEERATNKSVDPQQCEFCNP